MHGMVCWSAPTEVVHPLGWKYPSQEDRQMAGRRDTPKDIALKLRQIEVLHGQGVAISDAVRQIGVTEPTYHRWRQQYGGMKRDQLERLK